MNITTKTGERTPHEVLGVAPGADAETVRAAFRRLARQYHPDIATGPGAPARFRAIHDAYQTLMGAMNAAPDARKEKETTMKTSNTNNTPNHNANRDLAPETGKVALSETYRSRMVSIPAPVVPLTFQQLGIFVLDGSGSMSETVGDGMTKAQAVNAALRDLFTRFKASRVRSIFSFAVATFDEDGAVRLDATPADAVDDNADYDPQAGHGGGTRIASGLEQAETIARKYLAGVRPDIPATVVILTMSDGMCHYPDETRHAAARLKTDSRVTLCACHFAPVGKADPAAVKLLRDISSDPVTGYKTVYDTESLRGFFFASLGSGQRP